MSQEERILTDSGIRPTAIRIMVLREIARYAHAFTLSDMESRLPTLDRSTLFRTLTLFVQHRLLHEADNGCGSKLFCLCECDRKHQHTPHIHFTCTVCHETFCIKNIDLSLLPNPVGYEVEEVNLIMKGLCPKCRDGQTLNS